MAHFPNDIIYLRESIRDFNRPLRLSIRNAGIARPDASYGSICDLSTNSIFSNIRGKWLSSVILLFKL